MEKQSPSTSFLNALGDYRYLLQRNYPDKAVLQIIGTRYALSAAERSMLLRGVFDNSEIEKRQARKTNPAALTGQVLQVDGLNQLFTVVSYLSGCMVYRATDGFVRDASEYHAKLPPRPLLQKGLQLLYESLVELAPHQVVFYIDEQHAGHLLIRSILQQLAQPKPQLGLTIKTLPTVDAGLISAVEGVVCTSDTKIVNQTQRPVFDLAEFTLLHHFQPNFVDLSAFI